LKLYSRLNHEKNGGDFMKFNNECQQRNTCIVLGCLAAKLAGEYSIVLGCLAVKLAGEYSIVLGCLAVKLAGKYNTITPQYNKIAKEQQQYSHSKLEFQQRC
jgi:mevalonate kinase